ncbi:hypothetical protein BKA66DRAFT_154209 [Pyrenochaeta sp. MPI-SDFR-AT-0127]|nr:hypothetical protein BKA66DRAFT_154209 [Pyrenochaeta sp. MPI-SDFR-AT-0127]
MYHPLVTIPYDDGRARGSGPAGPGTAIFSSITLFPISPSTFFGIIEILDHPLTAAINLLHCIPPLKSPKHPYHHTKDAQFDNTGHEGVLRWSDVRHDRGATVDESMINAGTRARRSVRFICKLKHDTRATHGKSHRIIIHVRHFPTFHVAAQCSYTRPFSRPITLRTIAISITVNLYDSYIDLHLRPHGISLLSALRPA